MSFYGFIFSHPQGDAASTTTSPQNASSTEDAARPNVGNNPEPMSTRDPDNIYGCYFCPQSFASALDLGTHILSHVPQVQNQNSGSLFQTPKGGTDNQGLKASPEIVRSINVLECQLCRQLCRDELALRGHLTCVHGITSPESQVNPPSSQASIDSPSPNMTSWVENPRKGEKRTVDNSIEINDTSLKKKRKSNTERSLIFHGLVDHTCENNEGNEESDLLQINTWIDVPSPKAVNVSDTAKNLQLLEKLSESISEKDNCVEITQNIQADGAAKSQNVRETRNNSAKLEWFKLLNDSSQKKNLEQGQNSDGSLRGNGIESTAVQIGNEDSDTDNYEEDISTEENNSEEQPDKLNPQHEIVKSTRGNISNCTKENNENTEIDGDYDVIDDVSDGDDGDESDVSDYRRAHDDSKSGAQLAADVKCKSFFLTREFCKQKFTLKRNLKAHIDLKHSETQNKQQYLKCKFCSKSFHSEHTNMHSQHEQVCEKKVIIESGSTIMENEPGTKTKYRTMGRLLNSAETNSAPVVSLNVKRISSERSIRNCRKLKSMDYYEGDTESDADQGTTFNEEGTRNHSDQGTISRRYKCHICMDSFSDNYRLNRHCEKSHMESQYLCATCNIYFSQ